MSGPQGPFPLLMLQWLLRSPSEWQLLGPLCCLWPSCPLTLAGRHWNKTVTPGLRVEGCWPRSDREDARPDLPGVLVSFMWLDLAKRRPRALTPMSLSSSRVCHTELRREQRPGPPSELSSSTSQPLFQIDHFPDRDSSPGVGVHFLPQADNNRH